MKKSRFTFNGRSIELEFTSRRGEVVAESGNYTDGTMEDLTGEELEEAVEENFDRIDEDLQDRAVDSAYDRKNGR